MSIVSGPRSIPGKQALAQSLRALAPSLLVLLCIAVSRAEVPGVSRPEELSAEVRARYESLRDDLRKAEQSLKEAETVAGTALPARAVAREYVERARAAEARTAPLVAAVQAEFAARGSNDEQQFQQWMTCDSHQAARIRTDEMQASERDRSLLVWYARHLLAQMSRRPAALPPALRDAVPENPDALTDAEAVAAFRVVHERLSAATKLDCAKLEQTIAPSKQTRELVRQASIAAFDLTIANDCASAETPEAVLAAERRITELNSALSDVWPGWVAYEAQVAKAKFHDEHPAAAHKEFILQNPPLPVQPGPNRVPWIVGSLILLATIAGLIWWTSRPARLK